MKVPEQGDYVIVRVTRVTPYGAFCELEEYPEFQGFIHISEVSTSWVKNIRRFVREGQRRVAKVLNVSPEKRTCDLSLKRVTGTIERRKLEEVARKKRGEGLLRVAQKITGEDPEKIIPVLEDAFGDVLAAFEEAAIHGGEALADVDIPETWKEAIVEVAKKYIEIPKKKIRAEVTVTVPGPKGAVHIRSALSRARDEAGSAPHTGIRVYLAGSPRYTVEVESHDYKNAEKALKVFCEVAEKEISKAGGEFSWRRLEE